MLKDRLEDQIRELRLLLSDIDTHRDTVDGVVNQAKALVGQQSNHRLAKRVETKLKDVLSRLEIILKLFLSYIYLYIHFSPFIF